MKDTVIKPAPSESRIQAESGEWLVYKHTSPSGKVYIGITSQRATRRWHGGNAYKHNRHFYSAIRKYGWKNIKHEILRSGLTADEAERLEAAYIHEHRSNNPKYGYNMTIGGIGTKGYKHTEEQLKAKSERTRGERNGMYGKTHSDEQKEAMRQRTIERWSSEENRKRQSQLLLGGNNVNARPVVQLSKSGDIIKRFDAATSAERDLGISHSDIIACCRGKNYSAGGFMWRYDEADEIDGVSYTNKLYTPVFQKDKDGNIVGHYYSVLEAARETGICRTCIYNCLEAKQKTSGGFIWERA